jgi:hypothetical protein
MNKHCRRILQFSLTLLLCAPLSWTTTIDGSTATFRSIIDTSVGQVYIYDGGFFDSGRRVTTFSLLDDLSTGTRLLTPLLFEQTSTGVFTVRGVGTGESLATPAGVQMFDFGLVFGTNVTTNANFTFGFITALVNSSGGQTSSTAGSVDMNFTVDPGTGVGGVGTTNDWVFTPTVASITVALGTTFATPGHTGTFALNNPAGGAFNTDRTYSANLTSVAATAGVPEPGTLMFAGIGSALLLGVSLWRKRTRLS